jgi:hypothetical protein
MLSVGPLTFAYKIGMTQNKSLLKNLFLFILKMLTLSKTGVDVKITIFCDFCQLTAKKLAFLSKTNVMINFFEKTSSHLSKKRQYYRQFLLSNIFQKS